MPLSLDSLQCFAQAARLLNFRAAARAVSLSPAALGQRIKQLEDELEAELFQRTTRSVMLTRAGLNLLPYAHQALSAAEDCRRAGRGELALAPMEITLGTRHELGLSWVLPMLDKLEASRPGLTLHLYFGSGPDLNVRVHNLVIDCAITSARITDPKLDSVRLHQERYVFVGAAKLLNKQPLRSPKDAKQHTLFDTTQDLPLFRYLRDTPGGVDSLQFNRIVHLGTLAAIYDRVLHGKGVAVLPEYFVSKALASKRLVRILPKVQPLSDYFRLMFRADDPRRPLFLQLAEIMCAAELR